MTKKVTKAIIMVAGQGTRFLPQTKAMPKEMLPIIDKPIVQYVVEEAVAAGITDIIMVTGAHKRSIEDHFDHQYELEASLKHKGKFAMATQLRSIAEMANFIYIRQKGHPGTGTPVLNAAPLLNDEPFLVLYGDDLFHGPKPRAVQMVEAYQRYNAPVIASAMVRSEDAQDYGIFSVEEEMDGGVLRLNGMVERPNLGEAPSLYANLGGCILNHETIDILETTALDQKTGELFLTDALNVQMKRSPFYAKVLDGTWHDTGNPAKYLRAMTDYALAAPDLGPDYAEYLKTKIQ